MIDIKDLIAVAQEEDCKGVMNFINNYCYESYLPSDKTFVLSLEKFINDIQNKSKKEMLEKIEESIDNLKNQ